MLIPRGDHAQALLARSPRVVHVAPRAFPIGSNHNVIASEAKQSEHAAALRSLDCRRNGALYIGASLVIPSCHSRESENPVQGRLASEAKQSEHATALRSLDCRRNGALYIGAPLVIPAKAGIQYRNASECWIPAFAGMTGSGFEMSERDYAVYILANFVASLLAKTVQCDREPH